MNSWHYMTLHNYVSQTPEELLLDIAHQYNYVAGLNSLEMEEKMLLEERYTIYVQFANIFLLLYHYEMQSRNVGKGLLVSNRIQKNSNFNTQNWAGKASA